MCKTEKYCLWCKKELDWLSIGLIHLTTKEEYVFCSQECANNWQKNEMRLKKTKTEIIQIVKNFHKGLKLIKEAEELMKGVVSLEHEIKSIGPAMIRVLYEDGWVYRVKAEDLIK